MLKGMASKVLCRLRSRELLGDEPGEDAEADAGEDNSFEDDCERRKTLRGDHSGAMVAQSI